ncbi:hypothetical protein GIB67_033836 [Kingdonia uniflora]|uniref:DWD hypersensitive to UV-B 1 N-terminal domain-containing protein n=1 Tax=Kingdonia uniflora TaxID=39325 RepID=A0A7J7LIN5_9MAGN|nr:hypothetical protein GIB67_033836 [Kingdonia uniflora]
MSQEARLQQSRHELCILQLFLDQLKDVDFPPLLDAISETDFSEIDAIDILHESSSVSNGEYILSLMRAVNQKLRVVQLNDLSFGKNFLWDLSCGGFSCKILDLRSSHIQKLNITGKFMQLHTLNLDFSVSLTSFCEHCFTCMPNLMHISLCETRVANLWTTSAALSKLPSLTELRFQNCLCCNDTGPCMEKPSITREDLVFQDSQFFYREETLSRNMIYAADLMPNPNHLENTTEESSDESDVDFPSHQRTLELFPDVLPRVGRQIEPVNEVKTCCYLHTAMVSSGINFTEEERRVAAVKNYVSHHPSPICFEKHYREFMVTSLPRLKVLDNMTIKSTEREIAKCIFSQYYEFLPYNRQRKENLVNILQNREMGAALSQLGRSTNLEQTCRSRKSQSFFSRSISAAKVGSSAWPLLHPLAKYSSISSEERKRFRPRQFEYHPTDSSLMVFGTLDGEIVAINHENGKLVGYLSSTGALNSVLGLCWLKMHPSKLIAGSDSGSLRLYDTCQMPSTMTERCPRADIVTFDEFEQLTSVHVNSTDEQFIASGYSNNVALYDIGSGSRLQVFTDMHRGHINVVKFAHHSPSIFATSSFDRDVKMWDLRQKPLSPCYTASSSRGNVMVCFSPDDHFLLASAVDNEVQQLLAVDGRVHLKFDIATTGSGQNYTRSYYMNGRDYIISGSCDEHVVRICCAQTGRRLKDITLEVIFECKHLY